MPAKTIDRAAVWPVILARLAEGESLIAICESDGMPSRAWVFDQLAIDREMLDEYTRAKTVGIERMAEELVAIADDGRNDWMQSHNPDNPGYQVNGEHHARSRLRIDTRKWVLAKLIPKKYGESSTLELAGSIDTSGLTPEQRTDKLNAMLALAAARASKKPAAEEAEDCSDLV